MTYAEKQLEKFNTRTARFLDMLNEGQIGRTFAEEGGLIIETVIAIAGPDAMACYARNALMRSKELNGICPWDHDDDASLHPVVAHGMCEECGKKAGG